jgi:hypothetical protein
MTRATVEGLRRLVRPEDVAQLRGKTIAQVLPVSRARAREVEEARSADVERAKETPEVAGEAVESSGQQADA